MDNKYKWILFDLGGVLVQYEGVARLQQWMGGRPFTNGDMHRRWLYSPAVRAFERGKSTGIEFAHAIIDELELDTHAEEFLSEFPDFVRGVYDGADELLDAVGARFPLAVLSNTNRPQWEKLIRTTNLRPHFQKLFLSFEIGLMKPDLAAYAHVVRELGCEPEQVLFFDDNPANIAAAQELGIDARLVEDFDDLRAQVEELLETELPTTEPAVGLTVRPAAPSDLAALQGLLRHAGNPGCDEDTLRRELFTGRSAQALLACEDGVPVGAAVYHHAFSPAAGRQAAYLTDIITEPGERGVAHRRALLRSVARIAAQRGWERLEWMCSKGDEACRTLAKEINADAIDRTLCLLQGDALRRLGD